jgi:hypothetical protein
VKAGEGAREPRELLEPLPWNTGAFDLSDLEEEVADVLIGPPLLTSFLSRLIGPDHSLSVAAVLAESSKSSVLLPPPPLVEADPETKLKVDELLFISLSLSFSSNPMKIRERASL